MKKAEFVRELARSSGQALSLNEAAVFSDALIMTVMKAIRSGGKFSYPGFGSFTLLTRKARLGRNPRTGEALRIKSRRTVRFKPARALRRSL